MRIQPVNFHKKSWIGFTKAIYLWIYLNLARNILLATDNGFKDWRDISQGKKEISVDPGPKSG